MPEITGAAFTGTWAPCCWCGEPTDSYGDTPGRPDLGRVPIHIFCSAAVLVAFRKLANHRAIWGGNASLPSVESELATFETRARAYLLGPGGA